LEREPKVVDNLDGTAIRGADLVSRPIQGRGGQGVIARRQLARVECERRDAVCVNNLGGVGDRLASHPAPSEKLHRCRVLYVSPLKALAVDVERNLRAPLTGIRQTADRLGVPVPDIRVGVRSGDTPAPERRRLATTPPDILNTTPESLFLMLTSQAREALRGVETVIVDEVHAVAGTKRGAHLALSLERLDALLDEPAQRIGLSATVRPVEEVARFLGGVQPVEVVAPG
jgi:ATP-dependent Lhr-like helicase